MTEQDAKALADRLARVWGATIKPEMMVWSGADGVYTFKDKSFRLIVRLKDGDIFECRHLLFFGAAFRWRISGFDSPPRYKAKQNLLSLFRRNCWLSGCPIDASYHEKESWAYEARESGTITREQYEALLSPGGTICSN